MKSRRASMTGVALVLLLLIGTACVGYGNVGTVKKTVEANGARAVQASFAIGDGHLDVSGGADSLMRADFTTNDKRVPVVSYDVQDDTGSLKISQSDKPSGINVGPQTNQWSINLNDDIPLDLKVNSQSAEANLTLDTLTVRSMDFSTSSGDSTIALSGMQRQLGHVSLRSASGAVHLTMDGDYQSAVDLAVDCSSGSVDAKLDGKWGEALNAEFMSASGSITITVPTDVGVRVTALTDSGFIDAPGFTDEGHGVFVTDPSSPVILTVNVQTSSGNISLRTGG